MAYKLLTETFSQIFFQYSKAQLFRGCWRLTKALLRELEKKDVLHPGTGKVLGTFGPPLGLTPTWYFLLGANPTFAPMRTWSLGRNLFLSLCSHMTH